MSDIQSTSVTISWQAVEGADRYDVTLTQMMGNSQVGLCSGSHTVSRVTSNLSIVVGQTDNNRLRAYTTYTVTVTAMKSSSGGSEPVIFTTDQESMFCYTH